MKSALCKKLMFPAAVFFLATGSFFLSSCGNSGSPALKEYLYAANTGGDTVTAFKINTVSGELTLMDEEVLEDNSAPTGLAVHPSGRFLYSANANAKQGSWWGDSNLATYKIGDSGELTPLGSTLAIGNGLVNIVFSPSGNRLFGSDVFGNTVALDVNYATGYLSETAASPVYTGGEMHGIAMHPSGEYLFVENCGELRSFVINASTSELIGAGAPISTGTCYVWLEVTPDGKYLYAADPYGGIEGYIINASTGALAYLGGFPVMAGGSYSVKSLAVTPDGRYIYSAQSDTDEIGAFLINSLDGSLSNVAGMPFATGKHPKSVEVESQGMFLYAASFGDHEVNAFAINPASGELTAIGNYPSGVNPKMIVSWP